MTTGIPVLPVQKLAQTLAQTLVRRLKRLAAPQPPLPEYQQWRDGLIRQRFWIGIGLALLYVTISGIAAYYEYFVNPERILWALELLEIPEAFETLRRGFVIHKILVGAAIIGLLLLWRIPAVRKRPEVMLLLLPWGITFVPEIVLGAFLGLPDSPGIIMFLAQAIIIPVCWRLHLLAQLLPIAVYFLVYPLLGLTSFGTQPIYSFGYTVELILICLICELGVHLFETTKQSEIKASLQLHCCIHSITHDLRTPVMGSLLLLRSLQSTTAARQPTQIAPAEMATLIDGSERLLKLMDTLRIPQQGLGADMKLSYQAVDLLDIVNPVLKDFAASLRQQNIEFSNTFSARLPRVYVDPCQIGRVFSNLLDNAIRHNPAGTAITLRAAPLTVKGYAMLKVVVSDSGTGIPVEHQRTCFAAYVRGVKSRYQPGLGLGLYICRQIIEAHGGQIGIECAGGTAVWFTLPR